MTSILPLVFVVTVTAVKQAYEDWLRHREDKKVNNAPAMVFRNGKVMVSSGEVLGMMMVCRTAFVTPPPCMPRHASAAGDNIL